MNAAASPVTAPDAILPWVASSDEDRLYRRVLLVAMGLLLVAAVTLPLLPLDNTVASPPTQDNALTRVILQQRPLPEPEPPAPVAPPPREQPPQPAPQPPAELQPPEPSPARPQAPPQPSEEEVLARAREAAASSGVLAFRDDLQSLRESVDVHALNQTRTRRGAADAQRTQRAVVTATAPTASGGINTDELSADTGGPALSGRETTAVRSTLAGAPRGGVASSAGAATPATRGGRSDEAIRRVMDRNKGAVFALYNRALRRDPMLQGKLVFEMVIAPDGRITELTLLSSGLADAELTRKLLARIRLISFGAADVITTRVNYALDFLPYT
ncbi:MAG: energy transducer TonB [Halioglobus sp.]|nr:energy transducer TonB [Halioglobus sp.]